MIRLLFLLGGFATSLGEWKMSWFSWTHNLSCYRNRKNSRERDIGHPYEHEGTLWMTAQEYPRLCEMTLCTAMFFRRTRIPKLKLIRLPACSFVIKCFKSTDLAIISVRWMTAHGATKNSTHQFPFPRLLGYTQRVVRVRDFHCQKAQTTKRHVEAAT